MKIILVKNNNDILGSDGLMYIDGRLNLSNVKLNVKARNKRFEKNFPHKLADSFYFVTKRLNRKSQNIKL